MKLFLLVVTLLFITLTVSAQPTPLQPSDIFAENVGIKILPAVSDDSPYGWDDEFRLMVIGEHIVPYPDGFDRVSGIVELPDESVVVSLLPEGQTYGTQTLTFNTKSKTFSLYQDPCKVLDPAYLHYSNIIENPWTVYDEGDGSYLCERATGRLSKPLPKGYSWQIERSMSPEPVVIVSPDNQWVAVIGQMGNPAAYTYREMALFSYNIASETFTLLGTFFTGESVYFDRWYENQVFIEEGNMGNIVISRSTIHVAEMGQAQSLRVAISDRTTPHFIDNPPRYVIGIENPYDINLCGNTTYDIETGQTVTLEMDGLCRPEYGSLDGVGYYRDVPRGQSYECCSPVPAEVATVPLIRYDTRTGERKELYRGEIEAVEWVSEDDKYAIFLIDVNGRIDRFPYLDDYDNQFFQMGFPRWELVDLTTGKGLIATIDYLEIGKDANRNKDWAVKFGIFPLDTHRFLTIYCNVEACGGRNTLMASVQTLNDNEVETEKDIQNPILLTPDKKYVLVWSRSPYDRATQQSAKMLGVNLYNLQTDEVIPLIKELDTSRYEVSNISTVDASSSSTALPLLNVTIRELPNTETNFMVELGEEINVLVRLPKETALERQVCIVTTETGVNLRVGPGGNLERFGTAEQGERLLGVAQAVSENDGLIWWQLESGGWVQSDFVSETKACEMLPDTNQSTETPTEIQPTAETTAFTCQLTTLQGVNFRAQPDTNGEKIGSALSGTALEADGQIAGADGFVWWRLVDAQGWVRQDLVSESEGCTSLPVVQ